MKKFILIALVITATFSACTKDYNTANVSTFDPAAQAIIDDATIKTYLAANPGIKATKDPSGLYYQIITQGTGANATVSSTITANYTGTLINGTVFDQSTSPITFGQVIQGWAIGVPLVKAGGRILLIIPSGLGYGNITAGSIGPNTVLIFTIDVLTVK